MDQAMNNPIFMKSLVRCHKLKRHARKQVFQNKIFYRELVKVYRWKQQVKQQVILDKQLAYQQTDNHQVQIEEPLALGYDYADNSAIHAAATIKTEEEPVVKLEPRISFQESSQPSPQFGQTPPPPPPSSSLSSNSLSSYTDTAATIVSGSTNFYTPPTSAGSVSNGSSSYSVGSACKSKSGCGSSGCSSVGGASATSHSSIANPNSYSASESTSSCSIQSCDTSYSPPTPSHIRNKSSSTHRRSSNQYQYLIGHNNIEEVADVDILRRNLWLMIVRREIPHAVKRKATQREHKLVKTKSIAQKCLSHIGAFRKRNSYNSGNSSQGRHSTLANCLQPNHHKTGMSIELQFHVNPKLTC